MRNLEVAELEPRQLLNGSRFSTRAPAPPSAEVGSLSAREDSPPRAEDLGLRDSRLVGQGRGDQGGSEIGPSRSLEPGPQASDPGGPCAAQPESREVGPT